MRLVPLLCCAVLPAAESGGPLALLGPLWPRLRESLPTVVAGAHLGAESDDGAQAEGSLYALGMTHPDPEWSYGLGLAWSGRDLPDRDGLPDRFHDARALAGVWRRLGPERHVVIVAAPGLSWADGEGFAAPSLGGLLAVVDRGGTDVLWAVGLAGIHAGGDVIVLPYAAALWHPGEWRVILSPVYLAGERLLGAHAAVGVQATVAGNAAPVHTAAGTRILTLWEIRTGAYVRWTPATGPAWTLGAGYAPLRRLDSSDGLLGKDRSSADLGAAPYLSADITWSW